MYQILGKKAAIYIRVSTTEQATDGYSLAAQEKILLDYCSAKQFIVNGIYKDEGVSAKDIKHRQGMSKLLNDVTKKQFDIVLVWKITRVTRSLKDLCEICEYFDQHNVSLVSYSESFDCSTSSGRMMRNMLGVIAQWEREVISENVKLAMTERAAQGKRTCSYVLGYDIDGDSLKINPKEAKIVHFIYETYSNMKNMKCVSEMCNSKGYKGKLGGDLKPESIHKILTRFIYCGYNSFRKTPYKGKHTPIISVENFNETQNIIMNCPYGRSRKNILVYISD